MRSEYLAKNISMGFISKLLGLGVNFIVRTVFILLLPKEFLGINGLFTSIFSVLNLSELGLGSAIVYAMYKPLADKDETKIRQLMCLYQRAYIVIGGVVAVAGVALLPVLPYLTGGGTELINMSAIYIVFLFETVTSYWFWAYRSSLLIADQKEYLATMIKSIIDVFKGIIRIILLLLLKEYLVISFYVYVLIGIASIILSNLMISRKVEKLYPFLKTKKDLKLPSSEKKMILRNVLGVSGYRIGSVVNNSLDTLLVSSFLGLSVNGIFSNYLLLTSTVNGLIWGVVTALIPSVGNVYCTEGEEKRMAVFRGVNFVLFWIYGFCGISLWVLLNPFIEGIWLNSSYLLSDTTVLVLFLDFITGGMLTVFSIFIEATGRFSNRGKVSILAAAVNVVLSVFSLLFTDWGIAGVVLATVLSRMLIVVPVYIKIVSKDIFKNIEHGFYKIYFLSLSITLLTGMAVQVVTSVFRGVSTVEFMIKLLACLLGVNISWFILFRKTKGFAYMASLIKNVSGKVMSFRGE